MSLKQKVAQRLRYARKREERRQAALDRECPKYIHARIDLIFEALTRLEIALKHIDSKAQTAIIRNANLQVEIAEQRREFRALLGAVKAIVYDPQAHRHEEAEKLDQVFQNAK